MNTKKKIIIVQCNDCGKENRIREINLSEVDIQDLNDNHGCYCSKCSQNHKNEHKYSKSILMGEIFTVFPKVINIEHIKGVRRAKDILNRGLEQKDNNNS